MVLLVAGVYGCGAPGLEVCVDDGAAKEKVVLVELVTFLAGCEGCGRPLALVLP